MNIDQNAKLYAKNETVIFASVDKVWSLITGINMWSRWQPDISSAMLEGGLSVGSTFKWKAKGLDITSTIRELDPLKCIGWTGNSMGMSAIHFWYFEPEGNSTRVTTEESINGWLAALLKTFDPTFLKKSLSNSLHVLKTEAEKA